jgi:LysM repeat protein
MRAVRRAQSTSVVPSWQAAALLYRLLMAVVATAALLIVWRPRVVHAQGAQSVEAQASDSAAAPSSAQAQATRQPPATTTHVVKPGETLWSLAARYYGDGHQWQELARRNGIAATDGAPLRVGQRLTVPARRVASGSKAAAAAAAPADSTVPRVALAKAGEGTLPTPPAAARSAAPAGRGSLAAQTAGKSNAAGTAGSRPTAQAAAPKPAQSSAQSQAQADTSRANLTPQVGTMLGERSLKRIGLVDQSTQAASRKPAEGETIFHLDMPDAAEAERRTRAALRPNVPVLRQAEFEAAPYLATESLVKSTGRIVARRGASAEADQTYPQRALKTDEVEVRPPTGTTWAVGQRLVAFTTQTLSGANKGRQVVVPTGVLEVRKAEGGSVAIAEVLRQSGRVEQGQQLVAAAGEAAPRVQAQKLASPDVNTSVLWLDPNELLPTLSSYLVLGAGADKGLKPGDEVALYAAVAGAQESVMATARIVRVDASSSTAVIVSQQGREIAVGMSARRFAKAPE